MTHEERARAAILQWYAETEQYFFTVAEDDEPLVHLLAEALAAVEREARADERERCVRADGGEVELPPSISEQEASAWWQGFNYGCVYVRTAIQTELPSEG